MTPPLCITEKEIERSADIISSVLNRAEGLATYSESNQKVSFNIASTHSPFENQFLQKRRASKLDLTSTKFSEKKSNMINIEIDKSKLNPQSDILSPYEQIQKNLHVQELEQNAELSSLDNYSARNPLDLLKLDLVRNEEEIQEKKETQTIDSQIRH